MIDLINDMARNRRIVRGPLAQLRKAESMDNADALNEAIKFFDRDGDIDGIRNMMVTRFATGIGKESDIDGSSDSSQEYTYYTREGVKKAIECNHYEIINTGKATKIAKALGITTNKTQRWDFYQPRDDGEHETDEAVADFIDKFRRNGGFGEALESADFTSVCIESALLHVYWRGRALRYECVLPTDVYVVYHESGQIEDDGIVRPIDYTDIEDASAVIIRTAHKKGDATNGYLDKTQYVAYVGACNEFPDGRMVTYYADNYWPIPSPNTPGVIDYSHTEGGPPANPLTFVMNHGTGNAAGAARCEYPVTILRGGLRVRGGSELMPTSTSLFESGVEIELAWSRILKYALDAARGKEVFSFDPGADPTLPMSLDIPVLKEGQHLEIMGRPASDSLQATEVVKVITANYAEGFDVPGYMILGHMSTTPESGIALAIQTQPLFNAIGRRIRINEMGVDRIWHIEKGMLAEVLAEGTPIPPATEQLWDPGRWSPPRDKKTEIEAILSARDGELIDHVQAVRDYHGLATDAEAQALIDKYTKRDEDYGKAAEPQPTSPFGFGGGGA